jgi:hypothetical protein
MSRFRVMLGVFLMWDTTTARQLFGLSRSTGRDRLSRNVQIWCRKLLCDTGVDLFYVNVKRKGDTHIRTFLEQSHRRSLTQTQTKACPVFPVAQFVLFSFRSWLIDHQPVIHKTARAQLAPYPYRSSICHGDSPERQTLRLLQLLDPTMYRWYLLVNGID